MKIIIPMAGLGTRFANAADKNPLYKIPKPFIPVRDIPMVRWATGSLPFIEHPGETVLGDRKVSPRDLIFVILKEHDDRHALAAGLREIYGDDITVITLPAVTRGASETALQAKPHIDPSEELIISDSDHHFDGTELERMIHETGENVAGIIPVFTPFADGIPKWSYTLTAEGGTRAKQVAEKDRTLMEAGAYANIGAYYFRKAQHFFDVAEEALATGDMTGEGTKREFYIAPLYQRMIEKGLEVHAAPLKEVWGLGTPDDLERFLATTDFTHPRKN